MTTNSSAFASGQTSDLIDPKLAMGWMHTARFLTTAAQLHHLPVVDAQHRLLGIVTQTDLIRALSAAISVPAKN